MPSEVGIQYGSFGLVVFTVVFLLVWFVRSGFPHALEKLSAIVDRVLTKIDEIESECRQERLDMIKSFREERELDRKARHDLINQLTAAIAQLHAGHDNRHSPK